MRDLDRPRKSITNITFLFPKFVHFVVEKHIIGVDDKLIAFTFIVMVSLKNMYHVFA